MLYDVGRIGVPDEILRRSGGLTAAEITIRKHVVVGALLLDGSPPPVLQVAQTIVDAHHGWDGTGHPNGLVDEDIPVEGGSRRSATSSTR